MSNHGKRRGLKWAARLGIPTTIAATAPLVGAQPSFAAPGTTVSYYENTTNTTTLHNQGCSAAKLAVNGTLILQFGRPAYNGSTYGVIDYGNNFDSDAQIETGAEAWMDGFYSCGTSSTRQNVTIGTSNYCMDNSSCSMLPKSYSVAGSSWYGAVSTVANYVSSHNYGNKINAIWGSVDAEPAYDAAYSGTQSFLASYNGQSPGYAMMDDGSLESGYWTQAQEYNVAFGGFDYPFPQQYHPGMQNNWETLDLWSVSNYGHSMYFQGVTASYPYDSDITPVAGWSQMLSALQSHSSTYQSTIPYLTNI